MIKHILHPRRLIKKNGFYCANFQNYVKYFSCGVKIYERPVDTTIEREILRLSNDCRFANSTNTCDNVCFNASTGAQKLEKKEEEKPVTYYVSQNSRYAKYTYISNRKKSFKEWPIDIKQKSYESAEGGFFILIFQTK